MPEPVVEAQEEVEPDELLAALEASHSSTEATDEEDVDEEGVEDGDGEQDDSKETSEEGAGENSEEDGKVDEEGAGETKEDEKKEETSEENEEVSDSALDEMREIKSLLRQTLRQNKILGAKVGRLENKKSVKEEYDEDGNLIKPEEEKVELSEVEVLQQTLDAIQSERGESFAMMAEILRNSKDYADLDTVCTQGNFDDIIEAVAAQLSTERGIDPTEAYLQASIGVWNRENPYKYAYNLIKKYHPAFASPEEEADEKKDTGKKTAKDVVKDAPGSVADMGGGGTTQGAWTAAKIDALPESELSKVPKAVYEKYMRDELD